MQGGEIIMFKTSAPVTYRELLAGLPAKEGIFGYLFMPKPTAAKPPLVVISIGSQGFKSGREDLYSKALTDIGIAAFVVDSFGPRGFSETTSGQGRLSMAGSTADALHAIAHIRNNSRIDGSRIGLLGYSRGGHASVASHHRALQQAVLGCTDAISAHVALYPALNPRWRNPQPTKAPMLMLYGEADDLVPAWKPQTCAKEIAAAGGSIELHGYPDAHHGFDSITAAKTVASANFSNCTTLIEDDGGIVEQKTQIRCGNDWAGFLDSIQKAFGGSGATVGYGPAPRDVAVARIQNFFCTHLIEKSGALQP
jgi:dienelactone hydrolase